MFHLGFLFHKFTIHAGSVNTSQTWDVMIDSKLLLPIIIIWLCWSLQEYLPSFGKWCNIHFIAFNVKLTMLVQYPKTTKLDILKKYKKKTEWNAQLCTSYCFSTVDRQFSQWNTQLHWLQLWSYVWRDLLGRPENFVNFSTTPSTLNLVLALIKSIASHLSHNVVTCDVDHKLQQSIVLYMWWDMWCASSQSHCWMKTSRTCMQSKHCFNQMPPHHETKKEYLISIVLHHTTTTAFISPS